MWQLLNWAKIRKFGVNKNNLGLGAQFTSKGLPQSHSFRSY